MRREGREGWRDGERKGERKEGRKAGRQASKHTSVFCSLFDYRNALVYFGIWLTKVPRNRNVLFCFLFLQKTKGSTED